MNADDSEKFAKFVDGLHAAYGREFKPAGISLWWEALEDWEFQAIRKAAIRHMRNTEIGGRMPMPADLIFMLRKDA